jgi:hypothetical protein
MAQFFPGEIVRQSGLYAVNGCPVCPSELTLVAGEAFPGCSSCTWRRYRLKTAIKPIENDPDFA